MPENLKTIALFFLIAVLFFLNAIPMNHGEKGGFCMHNEDSSTGADGAESSQGLWAGERVGPGKESASQGTRCSLVKAVLAIEDSPRKEKCWYQEANWVARHTQE